MAASSSPARWMSRRCTWPPASSAMPAARCQRTSSAAIGRARGCCGALRIDAKGVEPRGPRGAAHRAAGGSRPSARAAAAGKPGCQRAVRSSGGRSRAHLTIDAHDAGVTGQLLQLLQCAARSSIRVARPVLALHLTAQALRNGAQRQARRRCQRAGSQSEAARVGQRAGRYRACAAARHLRHVQHRAARGAADDAACRLPGADAAASGADQYVVWRWLRVRAVAARNGRFDIAGQRPA